MIDLSKINFPIYPLSKSAVMLQSPPYTYIYQYGICKLLDDSSKEGSLGQRRLKYEADKNIIPKFGLSKLNKPIFRYSDIFQFLNKTDKFIDSSGLIFFYKKSFFTKIRYHRIKKFVEIPTGYYIVVNNIHTRFYLNRAPLLDEKYAGVIELDKGYVLYELTDTYKKERRIKI